VWTAVWFLVVLKLPVLYLAWVIWWAVKDPPGSELELGGEEEAGPDDGGGWVRARSRSRLRPRRGPHGGPARRPLRARVARAKGRH
jgi:hypothetical protein